MMETIRFYVRGTEKKGIIPQEGDELSEGSRMEILTSPLPPQFQAELAAWEAASDEDMAVLDQAFKDHPRCRT